MTDVSVILHDGFGIFKYVNEVAFFTQQRDNDDINVVKFRVM